MFSIPMLYLSRVGGYRREGNYRPKIGSSPNAAWDMRIPAKETYRLLPHLFHMGRGANDAGETCLQHLTRAKHEDTAKTGEITFRVALLPQVQESKTLHAQQKVMRVKASCVGRHARHGILDRIVWVLCVSVISTTG